MRRTEAITRCIQELLISAKDEQFDAFIPCSERIVRAVGDMVVLFPDEEENESLSIVDPVWKSLPNVCRLLLYKVIFQNQGC